MTRMMSRRNQNLLLVLTVCWTYILALPTDNSKTPLRDDFTTDYAKRIIQQSKVAEMKGMLDTSIAPCDDFYGYACGNWHRHNPAQFFHNIMTDTFQLISKGFDRRLHRLLQSGQMKSPLEEKVQVFYQTCAQVNSDDVQYKHALRNVYLEYGELPVLAGEQWNASEFDLWRTIAQVQHKYRKSIILDVKVMRDIKNNTVNQFYLLPTENNKVANSKILNIFEDASLAEKLQRYFGVNTQLAKQTAKQINQFERDRIAGISASEDSFEDSITLFTVSELDEMYRSFLNVTEFLGIVLGVDNVPDNIYVYGSDYLRNTMKLLQETQTSTLANYVLWQIIEEYLIDSPPEELNRWCAAKVRKYFAKLVDHMIYERYRTAESEDAVHNMWGEIRNVFRQHLSGDKLDWISNKTRQGAIEKLDRMQLLINAYDKEDFETYYSNVSMDQHNYVANIQQVLMAQSGWKMDVTDITGYTPAYDIMSNVITIPVALLQPHYLWDSKYPQALKYATLGYLLAHEMIHGFDNDNDASLWDMRSHYEFEERRKCFMAQYQKYKYGGINLPLTVDQTENIADNAGIKLAYIAYQRWLNEQPMEIVQKETFSGLELNSRQLFFLGFAQLWCDDVQSMFKSTVAMTDNHAPSMYRVIGSLSNFQEFSWVFNCSQQAPMDPEFKCAIY
ncbi:neprilysin-4 [Drosophila nasuta]|uniref:neprilysin-4 n=1 Tax=Drosophila nasuta TaxID=42062 RepID=UPI00295EC186|nr:neprilysin-4 [Drosophila nasuta]